jgi:hypothetical protein
MQFSEPTLCLSHWSWSNQRLADQNSANRVITGKFADRIDQHRVSAACDNRLWRPSEKSVAYPRGAGQPG